MTGANQDIIPVLLGGDLNSYNVARAFHEKYGVTSHVFGRYAIGETQYSRFIEFHCQKDLGTPDIAVMALRDFASAHPGKALIVIGCTDEYVEFLIDHKQKLEDMYILPYTNTALKELLIDKADFYRCCEKYGIPYPKTVVVSACPSLTELSESALGFEYPIIVKPSSSIEYWHHPFDGMKKVWRASNPREAFDIIKKIYDSGYSRRVILQDTIPGGDSKMRVLTMYSDKDKHVKMACLGHVLLEEHTPKGLGNHAAIITESNPALVARMGRMLDDLGFRGFSNFDLKLDERDGVLKVFEINLRQGRSNNYITASGINIAALIVRDYIFNQPLEYREGKPDFFWHSVPRRVVYSYTDDDELVRHARELVAKKQASSPYWYRYDLKFNVRRFLFVCEHLRRHFKKYAIYCKKYR